MKHGPGSELGLDFEEPIVLGGPIGAAEGARFDLAAIVGDGEIGNGRILGLTASVGNDGFILVGFGEVDRGNRLGEGADLVDF